MAKSIICPTTFKRKLTSLLQLRILKLQFFANAFPTQFCKLSDLCFEFIELENPRHGLTGYVCQLLCQKRTPFVKIATHKHGMHRVDRSNLDGIIVADEECLSSKTTIPFENWGEII